MTPDTFRFRLRDVCTRGRAEAQGAVDVGPTERGDTAMKAIETEYAGVRFRSRLEARWAVFFDALGIRWEYEPEAFELSDGTRYLPDFRLHQGCPLPGCRAQTYVEVKPAGSGPRAFEKINRFYQDALAAGEHHHIHTLRLRGPPGEPDTEELRRDLPEWDMGHYIKWRCESLMFALGKPVDAYKAATGVVRAHRFWEPRR
jgi:hypothetical protein